MNLAKNILCDPVFKSLIALTIAIFVAGRAAYAQIQSQQTGTNIFGVSVDAGGVLRFDEKQAKLELQRIRARARTTNPSEGNSLKSLSLPELFAEIQKCVDSHREIPVDLNYLNGLTQIRYVLVYPEQKDLIIVGPAEARDLSNPLQPRGKTTGRPIMQLDDLITAIRMARADGPFGCSIDPPDHAVQRSEAVLKEYGNRPRSELAAALIRELGDQRIRLFGAPEDSRLAFVCVAADYQLKRYVLGLDSIPVAGMGNAVDNSRVAGNRFWFEAMYEPILTSPDHNAFELRGQRLQLKAGALPFDEQGATDKAKLFTKQFTEKMPLLAAAVPLVADLQNSADLAVVAKLIQAEKLDQRVGWDTTWLMDPSQFKIKTIPIPRVTATITNFTNGSLAAGGVSLQTRDVVARQEKDDKGVLEVPLLSYQPQPK